MLIWRSETLANRSWTLVGEAFPRNAGQLLSPAPAVQPHDQVVCADRERQRARGLQELRLRSQTRGTWTSWPLRTRRIALAAAARWARGPLGRAGVHVEKLNGAWTNGLNDTSRTSPPESPSMYKTAAGSTSCCSRVRPALASRSQTGESGAATFLWDLRMTGRAALGSSVASPTCRSARTHSTATSTARREGCCVRPRDAAPDPTDTG